MLRSLQMPFHRPGQSFVAEDRIPLGPTSVPDDGRGPGKTAGGPSSYERFKSWLQLTTLILSVIISIGVAIVYSPSIAANYLLGAMGGLVYLCMLGRSVDRMGQGGDRWRFSRFAVFIGLMVVATQIRSLQLLPIFFGFLSYKLSLFAYVFQLFSRPSRSR